MTNHIMQQHKQMKKGLRIGHININSLRNTTDEIAELISEHELHILAISRTHLELSFEDTEVYIKGYNIYRKDRNKYGGGVAVCAQHNIPVKICKDMIKDEIEALWVQVYIPHRKPILLWLLLQTTKC